MLQAKNFFQCYKFQSTGEKQALKYSEQHFEMTYPDEHERKRAHQVLHAVPADQWPPLPRCGKTPRCRWMG